MIALAVASSAMLSPVAANASTASPGSINTVNPLNQGVVFFAQTGSRTTAPACASLSRWAIDASTITGQSLVATLLTAYALGKQIVVVGTGNCSVWGDTETVQYFYTVG